MLAFPQHRVATARSVAGSSSRRVRAFPGPGATWRERAKGCFEGCAARALQRASATGPSARPPPPAPLLPRAQPAAPLRAATASTNGAPPAAAKSNLDEINAVGRHGGGEGLLIPHRGDPLVPGLTAPAGRLRADRGPRARRPTACAPTPSPSPAAPPAGHRAAHQGGGKGSGRVAPAQAQRRAGEPHPARRGGGGGGQAQAQGDQGARGEARRRRRRGGEGRALRRRRQEVRRRAASASAAAGCVPALVQQQREAAPWREASRPPQQESETSSSCSRLHNPPAESAPARMCTSFTPAPLRRNPTSEPLDCLKCK